MYRESHAFALAPKERHSRKFLVLYQTDFEEPLKSKEYTDGVRHSSDLWPQKKENSENGDFDARNYKLIQDYDPDGRGECRSKLKGFPSKIDSSLTLQSRTANASHR